MGRKDVGITDVLVLAAVERAERQAVRRDEPGVPRYAVMWHLGVSTRSGAARVARRWLDALLVDGCLENGRRKGQVVWSLTAAGRKRLRAAYAAGEVPALPESPQHRAWREARTLAGEEIERLRGELRDALAEAEGLLACGERVASDVWFAAAERLRFACWRVGSATHCLYEWLEPDEDRPDVDEHSDPGDERLPDEEAAARRYRRGGRRNTTRWRGRG